jgi:G:T-mismatch repair DNA endonuclease (very short patch repair protein)
MEKLVIDRSKYPMVLDWSGYKNTSTNLPCKCEVCGCVVFRSIQDFKYRKLGCKCKNCANISNGKTKLSKIDQKDYPMVTDWSNYENQETKLRCKCENCQKEVYKTIRYLKNYKKCHCKSCSYKIRGEQKIGYNPFISYSRDKYGVDNYSQRHRSKKSINITSNKANFEKYLKTFQYKPTINEVSSYLELSCSDSLYIKITMWDLKDYFDYYTSSGEKEISHLIEEFGYRTEKKRFKWGEVDVFIPELNIGIEYNGSFWHSDKQKPKDYHYNKTTNAENDGIRLIHIWEYEWLGNKEQIKSYIKAQLGLSKKISITNCKIKQRKFTYSIYYNSELVLSMIYSKQKIKNPSERGKILNIYDAGQHRYIWKSIK